MKISLSLPLKLDKKFQDIFKRNHVCCAYLFGSEARGEALKESDRDIAILLHPQLSLKKRFEIRLKLIEVFERYYKEQIDLVILNDISSLFFRYVIITEGKVFFEENQIQRVEFENKIISEYFDYVPFFDLYNKEYVTRNLK